MRIIRSVTTCLLLTACGGGEISGLPGVALGPAVGIALTWTAPSRNTDGTTLTDIAGYRIAWGASRGALTNVVSVPASPLSTVLRGMPAGAYFLTVSTVNSTGQVSDPSGILSATASPTP